MGIRVRLAKQSLRVTLSCIYIYYRTIAIAASPSFMIYHIYIRMLVGIIGVKCGLSLSWNWKHDYRLQ